MEKPLRGPALSKAIRDYVKQYIIEYELHGGDPLPSETQLAQDLGVGRSSVREAVKSLQSLGIVEVRHGNGLFVREYNLDPILETLSFSLRSGPLRLQELLRIRIWLETAVIREAVDKLTEADFAELDAIMGDWEKYIDAGKDHIDLDRRFHLLLYNAVENETLTKLFEVFWATFANLRIKTIEEGDPVITLRQHYGVLEAVKLRDSDLAAERLVDHFDYMIEHTRLAVASYQAKTQ